MIVKDVLILSSQLLDKIELVNYYQNNSSENSPDVYLEASALLSCYNLVVNEIATNYYRLKTCEDFEISTDILDYNILQKHPLAIEKITDENGKKISVEILPTKLVTPIKKGKIYYEYLPIKEELSSDFCFEFTPITSRAVALGIATEYLLIKGEYSEAENFNSRYKNALIGCLSPKTNKKIPARKWF